MNPKRYLTAIFCDDIRREEGNKHSYMGVYTGVLGVPAFPALLPRLSFSLSMAVTASEPCSTLKFLLYKDDQIIAQQEIPAEALSQAQSEGAVDDRRTRFATFFQIFPVQLDGPCLFRARAVCDGEEFRGGSLSVVDQAQITKGPERSA